VKRLSVLPLLIAFFLASSASAEPIRLKRGLALDIWVTWPDEKAMMAKGFLDVFPEWRKTVTPAMLRDVKAAGFDFLRVPIEPSPLLLASGEERARLIGETIKTAKLINSLGLKAVIDLHTIPRKGEKTGTDEILSDPAMFSRYVAMLGELAAALAQDGDPAMMALELLNEPTSECNAIRRKGHSPQWAEKLGRLHAAARVRAPGFTLVLSGACWGGAEGLAAIDPAGVDDPDTLWSFHSYEPFLASHQHASWTGGPESYFSDIPYPPELLGAKAARILLDAALKRLNADPARTDKRAIRRDMRYNFAEYRAKSRSMLKKPFRIVETWRKKHKIPPDRIILGEFGAIRQDQGRVVMKPEWRAALINDIRLEAEKRGFAWAVWSYGGSFAITLDDASRQLDPAILPALGLPPP
jgi:endoglucanase